MDEPVAEYIEAIAREHRPLFDRIHELILALYPDASVVLSYGMPTYKVGRRSLIVGVWKHGLSLYGWGQGRDGGFTARHPDLVTTKGTIRITRSKCDEGQVAAKKGRIVVSTEPVTGPGGSPRPPSFLLAGVGLIGPECSRLGGRGWGRGAKERSSLEENQPDPGRDRRRRQRGPGGTG